MNEKEVKVMSVKDAAKELDGWREVGRSVGCTTPKELAGAVERMLQIIGRCEVVRAEMERKVEDVSRLALAMCQLLSGGSGE